jgi:amidase
MIRARKLSAREVMQAHLDRISAVNPKINAIVAKLDDDRCLALADDADARLARGDAVGPLHGLPWAFKDLEDAVGFPNTKGSLIFKDFMPATDSVLVDRIRKAGVIPIGKTNVPEFAMGSHTYNKVYGTTRNPYDLSKTAGGSSGGAAAALATGMLPLADGSDLGGSLRNPGNFNNVVGFRPSVGAVVSDPDTLSAPNFSVKGPMGRTVDDIVFLLDVIVQVPQVPHVPPVPQVRVGWSPDLGGLPLDVRVRAVLESHRKTFEAIGCVVEDVSPDFSDADDIFLTIRRYRSAQKYGDLLPQHRALMKPEAIEEIERGACITIDEVTRATGMHARLLERVDAFFDRYGFFACAVNQVPPFDADLDWPKSIDGVAMDSYTSWMKSAYWVSVTCGPAISVPAGFTFNGLPIGIQLVGRRHTDRLLLELARGFENVTRLNRIRPSLCSA